MLLSAAGVACATLWDRHSFIRCYLIPQTLALAAFVAYLGLAGLLSYYITIYLPFMIDVRVGGAENSGVGQFIGDLVRFSPTFLPLLLYSVTAEQSLSGRVRWCGAVALAVAAGLMGGYDKRTTG